MRIAGLILLVMVLMVGMGSNLPSLIDVPPVIITFGGMIAGLLFAGACIPAMLKIFFSSNSSSEVVEEGKRGWKLAAALALGMGVTGTLIGLIIMLKNLDDPAALGPSMAIANLPTIYALVIAFAISMPIYRRLESKI